MRAPNTVLLDWIRDLRWRVDPCCAISQFQVEFMLKLLQRYPHDLWESLLDNFPGKLRKKAVRRNHIESRGLPGDQHVHTLKPALNELLERVTALPEVHIYRLREELRSLEDYHSVDVAENRTEKLIASLEGLVSFHFN